jgi:hypothetical protein
MKIIAVVLIAGLTVACMPQRERTRCEIVRDIMVSNTANMGTKLLALESGRNWQCFGRPVQ